jgi:hypothetical protein
MADKLKLAQAKLEPLLARRTALWGEQEGFKASLYYKKVAIQPAESERLAYREAYLEWFNHERMLLHTASWDKPAVQAERDRLRKAEEEAQIAYDIARLGEDAGKAYQLVLDELQQIKVEMEKVYRSIATIPRN